MTTIAEVTRRRIDVVGVVQGVGFRPHVARLARDLGLCGWVRNTGDGVCIEVQGSEESLERFDARLIPHAPPLAQIERTNQTPISPLDGDTFTIQPSDPGKHGSLAVVPPDTATCDACLAELFDSTNRRYRHVFITCTDCGPRWTIVTGLPYDRPRTTMADFEMCNACTAEYGDVTSRRYHAQPIACKDCGPRLHRRANAPEREAASDDVVLAATQKDLAAGRTVALKGIGGFHLVVDATNDQAVARLRRRKNRPDKPFAIMVKDLDTAREFAVISAAEERSLSDPARPIVLLQARSSGSNLLLSDQVAPNSPLIGIMLPYSPLHHLLFCPVPAQGAQSGHNVTPRAVVMTSGNVAGEPLVHRDVDAYAKLAGLADTFCSHDRAIAVPCDDSVVRIVDDHESPIRRSRGYAPLPITLPFSVPALLAMGGDIKNTCCVAAGNRALLSQHLGDMNSLATQRAFELAANSLTSLHEISPEVVVVDRHPGYRTTALAQRQGLPLQSVGHHHAHLAAVMAEHGVEPETTVVGFLFDGAGWGEDDTLWGGEMLVGNYDYVQRKAFLRPTRLPGGDAAVRHPWRMALAYLAAAGVDPTGLAPRAQAGAHELAAVDHQITTGFNSPSTSSMGRLFDAVASLLDVRHVISHEAQAAIELEACAASAQQPVDGLAFGIDFDAASAAWLIDSVPVIRSLADQVRRGADVSSLALEFHRAVASVILRLAQHMRNDDPGLATVALSGGVFQNHLLTSEVSHQLAAESFTVLTHRVVPANDGGLSLGQAAIAGRRLARLTVERSG